MPQIGLTWELAGGTELFASAADNVRAFPSSGTSGPFSTSDVGFAAIKDTLEAEKSTNYEAGMRFTADDLYGLIAVYYIDFENRLLNIQTGPGIVGNPSVLVDVGAVETKGVEAAFMWNPMTNFTWFNSLAWNDSEYANDYTVTNSAGVSTLVPVAGKQVTDAPELLIKSEFAYDDGSFFARLDVNFTDERYYTYLNHREASTRTRSLTLGFGYRFRMKRSTSSSFKRTLRTSRMRITSAQSTRTASSTPTRTGPHRTLLARAAPVLRIAEGTLLA